MCTAMTTRRYFLAQSFRCKAPIPAITHEIKMNRLNAEDVQNSGMETTLFGIELAISGTMSFKDISPNESIKRNAPKAPNAIRDMANITTPFERTINL